MNWLLFLIAAFSIGHLAEGQSVAWVASTDQSRWAMQPSFSLRPIGAPVGSGSTTLLIDPGATDQTVRGWGGCFNELGWKALLTLAPEQRDAVLKAFFDPTTGLKFNICRVPIGASDFALDGYSLDDVKDDFSLKHFSIGRDRSYLIPFIKAAMTYRPDLKIWASPWSPPGWMKTSGVYDGGTLLMQPEILKTYAQYLARFVLAYHGEGINVYAVHVQNEPVSDSIYPTCPFKNPEPLRDFIRDYLGPCFVADKVPAKIWLGTMSESRMQWFKVILDDPGASRYISGIGLQYQGRFAATQLHTDYPGLPLMETETRCHAGANDWKDAEDTFEVFRQFLSDGVESYMYWNMVLDQTGLSTWGWRQNSPVVIDTQKHTITYTPEFYAMKHFSTYVIPGSIRLKTTGGSSDALAFKTPDGAIVVVVANETPHASPLTLVIGHRTATVSTAPHSFDTFVCR